MTAYVGDALSYTSDTHSFFVNRTPTPGLANDPVLVPSYALVDLRAGVETENWQFQVWGRNVGNTYYWTEAIAENGSLVHYTGMPVTYGITISHQYR
jgi:outer membrane receptor protein involved in Fe transport